MGNCLTDGDVLGWVEGRLSAEARAAAGEHGYRCAVCFALVAEVARATCAPADSRAATTLPAALGSAWTSPAELEEYR